MLTTSMVTAAFPIVAGIVGTIAVFLGGISKFKEKRQETLMEATTTWKHLAESRQAALEEEKRKNRHLATLLLEYRDREEAYTERIRALKTSFQRPAEITEVHDAENLTPLVLPNLEGEE